MTAPSISVVITSYRQPATLRVLLLALAEQKCSAAYEVIVCDDGSDPDVLQACAESQRRHGLDLRYVWQPDEGFRAARSRNNGIRCAQGRLLVFLDADVIVKPDFLERQLKQHAEPDLVICSARRWITASSLAVLPGNSSITEILNYLDEHAVEVDRLSFRRWMGTPFPWMACASYCLSIQRSPSVLYDEGFEGWGGEDRELACRLVHLHGYRVLFTEDIEVYHLEYAKKDEAPFSTLRPLNHADIVRHIRNKLYFLSKFPDLDLLPTMECLLSYTLDPASGRWCRLARDPETTTIIYAVREAASWLFNQGLLPEAVLRRVLRITEGDSSPTPLVPGHLSSDDALVLRNQCGRRRAH